MPSATSAGSLIRNVIRDVKLHSILLGWMGFLTKSCVSPQVFHGSRHRRAAVQWPLLTGVWSLPGNVANLAASTPGDALELEDMVKLTNQLKRS